MAEAQAQAWWADVEHLRERIERRREAQQGTLQSYRAPSVRASVAVPAPRRPDGAERHGEHVPPPRDAAGAHGFIPRRTVRIRGQAIPTVHAPQLRPVPSPASVSSVSPSASDRRPPRGVSERVGDHPDRLALWAVLLGVLLALVAVASAHGAVGQTPARGAAIVRPVAGPPSVSGRVSLQRHAAPSARRGAPALP